MHVTDQTIQKFFDHKCTREEAEAVAAYLQEHPEVHDRFLAADWKVNNHDLLSADETGEVWENIRAEAGIRTPVKWIRPLIAVAASLLAVVCVSLFFRMQKPQTVLAKNEPVSVKKALWQVRSNLSPNEMNIVLEDASVLKLQPQSTIKYLPFAGETKREICLLGETLFKVAKDRKKPFTVYAGGIATTAVGTEFSVSEKNGRVTVKLFEGKVRIHATKDLPGWRKKELYLLPGEEFVYDKAAASFEVKAIPKIRKLPAEKLYAKKNEHPGSLLITTANWYMFNNQSLGKVFGQLEEIYNVKIDYNPADVRNVYFIGRFEKTDSLGEILRNIALLKKLNIRHTGNNYVISRKKR